MKKALCVLYFTCCILYTAFAQDSCSLRISLLTCAPGQELYSTFGHTAIRVTDNSSGLNEVYNYGTFEFSPDFYSKFIRGKLLYALSVQSFDEFMYQYKEESRSVQEQELNFTCEQKSKIYAALQINAQPANRFYRYDFLFDNCTTRAKDMLAYKTGNTVQLGAVFPNQSLSFRDLIDIYLDKGKQDWSQLGIDLLLGAKMDRQATNEEAMFLPDNLLTALDGANLNGVPVVKTKTTILPMPGVESKSLLLKPIVAFGLLLLIILAFMFTNRPWAKTALSVFDFLFFFILGLVGVLLLVMWFGTDHALCANNYNLAWALPTHVVMAFFVHKKKSWVIKYFAGVLIFTVLLLLTWFFLPQRMNAGFLPIVLLIAIRSWAIFKNRTNGRKTNSIQG